MKIKKSCHFLLHFLPQTKVQSLGEEFSWEMTLFFLTLGTADDFPAVTPLPVCGDDRPLHLVIQQDLQLGPPCVVKG